MVSDLDRWINEVGPDFFKKNLGIKTGQKILDYGCGWGSNAIVISRIVGPEGYVYAFEKERSCINKMLSKADKKSKQYLKIILAREKIKTPIPDSEIDVVLLYDVIHEYYFNFSERKILFMEIGRIIKTGGLLSVFPHHISSSDFEIIKKEILSVGFDYLYKITGNIIHDSMLIMDSVYNFNKR